LLYKTSRWSNVSASGKSHESPIVKTSMRVLFVLPGLHRYDRGAEIAFISIASELAKAGDVVTLIGSGPAREKTPYQFIHVPSIRRERFESLPSLPCLRDETAYEELTFFPGLVLRYHPLDWDVTIGCSYPFTNWALRRPVAGGFRPPHVFVTENGDWPAFTSKSEYRFFGCEGLVCTNPDFYDRNKDRWRCRLIPNGVDCDKFTIGTAHRDDFGIPPNKLIVLMVSALIPSKRVGVGIEAVSQIPGAHLVVAGDGPLRRTVEADASRLLPGRFTRLSVPPSKMPLLYPSADVFLHLSKNESSSLAFLDAMACGLPVVAHESPQMRWIAGNDEYLIDTENSTDVAEQIKRAQSEATGRRERRLTKVADFSWKKLAFRYREFLEEIVLSRPAPNPS
jgi:glycosyltransferase involved in cell wall biosynthesis